MKILVNSLPKSGTHLVSSLLTVLGFLESTPGLTGSLLRETHRNPLTNWRKRRRQPKGEESGLRVDLDIDTNTISQRWLGDFLDRMPDQHFICGHLPYSPEMSDFLNQRGIRVLYIIRDPRDVLNSYINYQKKGTRLPFHEEFSRMTLDECIEHTLTEKKKKNLVTASLARRLKNSVGWATDATVYSTCFEALVGPSGGGDGSKQLSTLQEILDFLRIEPPASNLEEVASKIFNPSSITFNKGMIGQWKQAFTEEQQRYINGEISHYIHELGYQGEGE